MVELFMESFRINCPECGRTGVAGKLKRASSFHVVDEAFRLETRERKQVIVCGSCGARVNGENSG